MTLRVFTDRDGNDWQVWNVDPSSQHMGVRVDLRDGWLCFERVDGGGRCRVALSDAPPAWERLPAHALDRLRRAAAATRSSRAVTRPREEALGDVDEEAARRRTSGPKHAFGADEKD